MNSESPKEQLQRLLQKQAPAGAVNPPSTSDGSCFWQHPCLSTDCKGSPQSTLDLGNQLLDIPSPTINKSSKIKARGGEDSCFP